MELQLFSGPQKSLEYNRLRQTDPPIRHGILLLAAYQDSDTVVVFNVDPTTGRLSPTGQSVEVSMPTCITSVIGQ